LQEFIDLASVLNAVRVSFSPSVLVDNLLGQEQAGTLPLQLSVAARRKDDLPQRVVEILSADRVLGSCMVSDCAF